MAYIEVDVDLEIFDDEEVIEYAINRLLSLKSINRGKQLKQMKDILSDLFDDENDEKIFPVTLEDQMKLEHIRNVFNTYSFWEILKLIPEKNTSPNLMKENDDLKNKVKELEIKIKRLRDGV